MPVLSSLRVLPAGSILGFVLADVPGQPAYQFGAYPDPHQDDR